MLDEEMHRVCPGATFIGVARLPDFRLEFDRFSRTWNGGVVDAQSAPGTDIWGVVYEVPRECWKELDRRASAPTERQRIGVRVEMDGKLVSAETYKVVHPEEWTPPTRRYLDMVVTGARQHGLPADYVTFLERVEALAEAG
jgi:hypothetical protein